MYHISWLVTFHALIVDGKNDSWNDKDIVFGFIVLDTDLRERSVFMSGGGRSGGFAEDANFFDPPSVLTSNVDRPHPSPSFGRVKLFMSPLLVDRPPPHGLFSERTLSA